MPVLPSGCAGICNILSFREKPQSDIMYLVHCEHSPFLLAFFGQAKLTALVVNLKRIARMVSASMDLYALIFKFLYCKLLINRHYLIREQAEAI
jgi:hypothetical protein